MRSTLVSVVIPVYDGEQFLQEALDSVLTQTYSPIEVIVVNDGSTDGSEDVIRQYGGSIRYFRQENSGPSAARNLGIAHARGEWIAFQDADDIWDPDKIEAQFSAAEGQDALVHCDLRLISESGITLLDSFAKSFRNNAVIAPTNLADLLIANTVNIHVLVRREALEAVGGFDNTNRWGWVDYQLWLYMMASGHRFRYVDRALASYRRHSTNLTRNKSRAARGHIYALERTYQKYPWAFGRHEFGLYNQSLHTSYFDLGWNLYDHMEYTQATRYFRTALTHRPLNLRTWILLALCSLPFRFRIVPILRRWVSRKGTIRNIF